MNVPSIKDIVKNNKVGFSFYRAGFLYYNVVVQTHVERLYDEMSKQDTDYMRFTTFQFPVPISDTGEATFLNSDKALYFMRYIRKAIQDETFVVVQRD